MSGVTRVQARQDQYIAHRFDDQAPIEVLRCVTVTAAKSTRIEHELTRRGGLGLKRSGHELIGACPQCGGRDRFAVNTTKQVWLCRGCSRGGDVIAFVQHVDGVDFRTAVRLLRTAVRIIESEISRCRPGRCISC
jgi:phage/plasmid primase-like uncharacterized protein